MSDEIIFDSFDPVMELPEKEFYMNRIDEIIQPKNASK